MADASASAGLVEEAGMDDTPGPTGDSGPSLVFRIDRRDLPVGCSLESCTWPAPGAVLDTTKFMGGPDETLSRGS